MRILFITAAALILGAPLHAQQFRTGPGGVRVETSTETYEDQHHRLHEFLVPRDWRDYHHPLGWYRVHPQ